MATKVLNICKNMPPQQFYLHTGGISSPPGFGRGQNNRQKQLLYIYINWIYTRIYIYIHIHALSVWPGWQQRNRRYAKTCPFKSFVIIPGGGLPPFTDSAEYEDLVKNSSSKQINWIHHCIYECIFNHISYIHIRLHVCIYIYICIYTHIHVYDSRM